MPHQFHRVLFVLFSFLVVITVLSGCGPQATPTPEKPAATPIQTPQATKLTVWVLGNSGPGIKNALPGFKAKYPNMDVDLQIFGWNDLLPKLQATLTAGSGAPDVVEVFSNQMAGFVDSGAFTPLNDRIKPYQNDLGSYAFLDSMDAKGNIYAIVWSLSPMLLYYRSDILKAEGVDPASIKTWDDLITVGKKVTHGGQYMFLTASQSTQPQYFNYFTGMLSQLDGSLFDPKGEVTINNNNRGLRVMQQMQAIRDAKISMDVDAWWTPGFEAALKSGKVTSIVSGALHVDIMKTTDTAAKGLWRMQLAPTFKDGKPTGIFTGGGRGLTIPTQTKDKDTAWKFIEYMMLTPKGVEDTWKGGAIVPVYKPSFAATYFNDPDSYFGDQPVGRTIMDGLKALEGQTWYSGNIPSGVMANEIVGPQLRNLMTGKADAQPALQGVLDGIKSRKP